MALANGVAEGASDHVHDDETLYRSVVPSSWKQKSDGEFYLSSQAFADRNRHHPLTAPGCAATTRVTRSFARPTTSAASLLKTCVPYLR